MQPNGQQQAGSADCEGQAALFWWRGKRTAVIADHNGLLLEQLASPSCLPWRRSSNQQAAAAAAHGGITGAGKLQYVPYAEVLSVRYTPIRRYCPSLPHCARKLHSCQLQVLTRHSARPWQWSTSTLELAGESGAAVKRWVLRVKERLRQLSYRPRRLLVFVNPFGGRRRAGRVWARTAGPILASAGVECEVVETSHQGHAEGVVGQLSLQQLQQLDGLVAVGGDGLFSELLTALLTHTHLAAALQLRLGHIPAGSTDAVACTLHGTRDPVTAALHIALGDSTPLDVGRMVTLPPAAPRAAATTTAAAAAAAAAAGASTGAPAAPAGSSRGATRSSQQQQQQPAADDGGGSAAAAHGRGVSVGSHTELLLGSHPPGDNAASSAPAGRGPGRVWWRRQQPQQQREQRPAAHEGAQGGVPVFVPQLRHFVCVANYGFLGDVMQLSERLRWAGPMRYDIAGLLRFLLLRRYDATVWYKPAPLYPDAGDAAAGACVAGSSAHGRVGDGAAPHPPRTLLPPAAVAPLPYHHQPALHAKLAPPAAAPADAAAHLQQQQGAAAAAPCCDSGGSSSSSGGGAAPGGADASRGSNDSGSRRSSLDGCSGPLPAAGAPKQQHSRDSKSVSFSPAPPVAAVHVSAASFSSRGSASAGLAGGAGSGGGASGVGGGGGTGGALGRTSRASSVTSERSSSRCHARCSRCSAASLHHSSSRQSFAHIHSLLAAGGAAEDGPTHSSSPPPSSDSNALLPPPSLGSGGAAAGLPAPGAAAGAAPAPPCPPGPGWLRVEGGAFASIMCVVTSCISDKSRRGLMPEAHLADGRLALVLVQGCGRLQYLRFLLRLARRGIVADGGSDGGGGGSSSSGLPPFVKVVYATEVQVVQGSGSSSSDGGGSSCWNVDGELLRHGAVRVGIHAGLVDVFARGVELM